MDSREQPPPPPHQPPQQHSMLLGHHHHHQLLQQQHHHQQQQQQQHPHPHSHHHQTAPSSYPTMINPNMSPTSFPFNSVAPRPQSKPPTPSDGAFDGSSPPSSAGMLFSMEPAKKKRGRPRKYASDGNIALGLSPTPISSGTSAGHADSGGSGTPVPGSEPSSKRHRGRPPGSGKKQLDALGGVGGVGFTPHVLTVKAGEDIASKIMAFSQQGPRTVCILSANGAICNVTLRQPAMSGGTVTYEGRFEIISLSGSFPLTDNNGNQGRPGFSVSMAGSDGRVVGGGVAGVLMAASSVQVIVGSFIADGKKSSSSASKSAPSSSPQTQMLNFGGPMMPASPPSQGDGSESSNENGDGDGDESPINQNPGMYGNSGQPIHSMQMYQIWGQNQQ